MGILVENLAEIYSGMDKILYVHYGRKWLYYINPVLNIEFIQSKVKCSEIKCYISGKDKFTAGILYYKRSV